MKIVAIIPARADSKGLKNKNIFPILNKPLIEWTFQQAKQCKYLDNIFVTTNDEKVIELAYKNQIEVIRRPDNLSTDTSTSEVALKHALEEINTQYSIYPDIIVFLQATSPLRKENDICNAINYFIQKGADSLFSITRVDDLHLWQRRKNNWKSINFDYKNRKMRQEMPSNFIENGSIYIFKPNILINNKNRLGGKIVGYQMEFWQTWQIDTIEEIDLVEYYINKYGLDKIEQN